MRTPRVTREKYREVTIIRVGRDRQRRGGSEGERGPMNFTNTWVGFGWRVTMCRRKGSIMTPTEHTVNAQVDAPAALLEMTHSPGPTPRDPVLPEVYLPVSGHHFTPSGRDVDSSIEQNQAWFPAGAMKLGVG